MNGNLIVVEGAVGRQLRGVGIALGSLCKAPHGVAGSFCEAVKGGEGIQLGGGRYREGTLVL